MRIAVTGGAGFIGSHVVQHFAKQGHQLLVIDNLSSGQRRQLPDAVEWFEQDVNTPTSSKKLSTFAPDAVVHLAGQDSVASSMLRPAADATANVMGTVNVLQAASDSGAKVFVYASSASALYGDRQLRPTQEKASLSPVGPSGISTWCAEKYVTYFDERKGETMRCVSLRFGSVFGPRESDTDSASFISRLMGQMMQGQATPQIFGDGLQTRDFVFVTDAVEAVARAIEKPVRGTFNIASEQPLRLLDVVALLREVTDYDGPVEHRPVRANEVRHRCLSIDKARTQLGWEPATPLISGLCKTADSFFGDDPPVFKDLCPDVEMEWAGEGA